MGLDGEVTSRVGRGAPCLSDTRLCLLRQAAGSFTYVLKGEKACPPFPVVSSLYFSPSVAL